MFTLYWAVTVSLGTVGKMLHQMLVVQAFRADRLLAMAARFVAKVMGETFQKSAEKELDLGAVVTKEVCVCVCLCVCVRVCCACVCVWIQLCVCFAVGLGVHTPM